MISMLIVSHSKKIAEGTKEMARQMVSGKVKIEAIGGMEDGRMGTDASQIALAIQKLFSDDGVLVFYDLGSSMMSSEMAIESLPEIMREKVLLVHAPLVEGAVIAAVEISIGKGLHKIKSELEKMKPDKSSW